MAETATIARPYAEALFQLARETGSLAHWAERLEGLSALIGNMEMRDALAHPQVSTAQQVDLVLAACGFERDEALENLVRVLAENDRFACLPEIARWYEHYKQLEEGTEEALIYSAFPLDDAQIQTLMPKLELYFKTRLKKSVRVDTGLIGGIRVVVGDRVLDASVRGQLDAMATALNN